MADVLAPVSPRTRTTSLEIATAVRVLLATLSFTAGAIHLVMAPSHAGESTLEGVGFLTAGWLQIGLAAGLFAQTSRFLLRAAVALNLALIGVWAVSRTSGLPFGAHAGHPEQVTAVDLTTVAIEVALVVTCAAVLTRPDLVRSFRNFYAAKPEFRAESEAHDEGGRDGG